MSKLLIIFFALFIILNSLFINPVYAQADFTSKESLSTSLRTSRPTFEVFQTTSATPASNPSTTLGTGLQLPTSISPTSPLYTDLLVHNLFHSFSCLAVGQSVIGQPCLSYQVTQNAQGMIQSVPVLSQVNTSGGVLGTTTSLIGMLYTNQPVRTVDYLGSLGEQFGVVKTANAQVVGSGAAVLNPILRLWQVSRNISYVIMIIIFVIIGIMIMFRHKINPQTVITAQAALPGLVIGLIMITFSYFLAGLISDMAFIGTNVVGYYFSAVRGEASNPQNLVDDISQQNILSIFSPFTGVVDKDQVSNTLSVIWPSLGEPAQRFLTWLGVFVTAQTTTQATEAAKAIPGIGQGIQAVFVLLGSAAALQNPTGIAGLALAFIATAILLYSMFKLLLRLINAYISIIFLTITAPFQLLAAALPGRQGIASNWILNMLGNILVFPAVLAVLYFAAYILGPKIIDPNGPFKTAYYNQIQNGIVGPVNAEVMATEERYVSIVDKETFPLFGGMTLNFINLLLAFGALIALPAIPDIIVRSVGKVGQAGQLIGQEIGGQVGQGRQYAGQFQQGIGAASGQAAQARGLLGTPAYMPTGFNEKGNPTGWQLNPTQYQPNILQKWQARTEAKAGRLYVPKR